MIEVKEETINKINIILAGIKDADKKVLKPAMARALMAGKTAAKKEVREAYHISAGDFNSKGKIKYNGIKHRTDGSGFAGSIEYSGAVIPLMKYNVSPGKPTPRKEESVSASVLKSSTQEQLNNAFVAKMKNGHLGVFERTEGKYTSSRGNGHNKHTEKIKELFSPSVPHMVEKKIVMKSVEEKVQETLDKRIEHEIDRIFKGIGG